MGSRCGRRDGEREDEPPANSNAVWLLAGFSAIDEELASARVILFATHGAATDSQQIQHAYSIPSNWDLLSDVSYFIKESSDLFRGNLPELPRQAKIFYISNG